MAADVQVESYTYDEAGRRITETNGEDETTRYDFDLNDQIVRRVTPSGYETFFEYDELGKKTREVNANGDEQSWAYDDFGRLVSSADMAFADTHYEYDQAGHLIRKYSDHGQDITYTYDSVGRLVTVLDEGAPLAASSPLRASSKLTEYEYDEQNRRTRERTTIEGVLHSDTHIEYDTLGRLKRVSSSLSTVEYSYDAAGNRTRIHATYFDHARHSRVQDLWYTYDSMNRVLISQGVNNAGQIGINTAQGIELTYNEGGQRITSRTYRPALSYLHDYDWEHQTIIDQWSMTSGITTETYGYDGLGRLTTTISEAYISEFGGNSTVSFTTNERQYDRASREISDTSITAEEGYNALTTRVRTTSYDGDGRVFSQSTKKNGQVESVVRFGDARYTEHFHSNTADGVIESYFDWTLGYDKAGVLRGYSVDVYDNGQYRYTTTYRQNYLLTDTYLQTTEDATSSSYLGHSVPLNGSTKRVYNVNGEMVEFHDTRKPENSRFFAYNTDGQVVTSVQGTFATPEEGQQALEDALLKADNESKAQHFFFANGQQIGSFGQLTTENGAFEANFDVNFTPVSPGYPTAVPSQVVVQEGETLRSLAMRVFGDASLWYLIAEENGLTDPDAVLTEGTVLQIPNEVISLSNTSSSFKPFEIYEAIGDTTPTQPAPPPPRKKKGCGVLGAIIVVIVAIVVTVLTKGAATDAAATAINWAFGAGTASGGAGAFAAGAIGIGAAAAAGSIVSQGVAIAIGQQDKFSWKQVAAAGLAAGLTQGVGPTFNYFGSEIAQAAINNSIGQGVNIALGLQEEFNWGAVAAAAVAAPGARAAGKAVGNAMAGSFDPWVTDFTAGLAANGVQQLASVAFNGGRIDYGNLIGDAFGNALGNSIVGAMAQPQENSKVNDALRRAGLDPNDPSLSDSLLKTARGLVEQGYDPADIATYIGNQDVQRGIFGAADNAAQAIAAFSDDDIEDILARELPLSTGEGATQSDTYTDPLTGELIEEVTVQARNTGAVATFADNVLRPIMGAAATFGEFAEKHEKLATMAAAGTQIAMMGPAQFVKSTVVDAVVGATVGSYLDKLDTYIQQKASSWIEERWGFEQDEATFLAHGVSFAGQIVLDSARNIVGSARNISYIVRDEQGRFKADPANPKSPHTYTDAQRRADWKRLAKDPNSPLSAEERIQIEERGRRGPQQYNEYGELRQ